MDVFLTFAAANNSTNVHYVRMRDAAGDCPSQTRSIQLTADIYRSVSKPLRSTPEAPDRYSWERDVWRYRKFKDHDAVCGGRWFNGETTMRDRNQTPPRLRLVQRAEDMVTDSMNSFRQHPALSAAKPPTARTPLSGFPSLGGADFDL
ncbi:hypothetical protein F2P81_007242 [Scophthalmus maximus]|uniref:Uncharacterized protein n=1 Tax=Scophthalmus maximus TaxID=52904 RepID=A0A6A4TDU1_SCOMX|nr:hypothetical protein F2P81_007242 [Scophthalmus maximus]